MFAKEIISNEPVNKKCWQVLSVDDEPNVHEITKMALSEFLFEQDAIEIQSVNNAAEAKAYLKDHQNVSLVLLDIVMENENAGFEVVEFIRKDLNNHEIRIVMRTGQPGRLSEEKVISMYDVNGYAEKNSLTTTKLYAIVYSALRAYKDIHCAYQDRQHIENLVKAIEALQTTYNLKGFAKVVLKQSDRLLNNFQNLCVFIAVEGRISQELVGKVSLAMEERTRLFFDKEGAFENDSEIFFSYAIHDGSNLLFYSHLEQSLPPLEKMVLHSFVKSVRYAYEMLLYRG